VLEARREALIGTEDELQDAIQTSCARAGIAGGAGVGAAGALLASTRGRNSGQSIIESSSKPGGRQTGRTIDSPSGPRTCRP
jgi:hypothetical protein